MNNTDLTLFLINHIDYVIDRVRSHPSKDNSLKRSLRNDNHVIYQIARVRRYPHLDTEISYDVYNEFINNTEYYIQHKGLSEFILEDYHLYLIENL